MVRREKNGSSFGNILYKVHPVEATLAGFHPYLACFRPFHWLIILDDTNHTRVCGVDVAKGLVVVGRDSLVTFVYDCTCFWHRCNGVYLLLSPALTVIVYFIVCARIAKYASCDSDFPGAVSLRGPAGLLDEGGGGA